MNDPTTEMSIERSTSTPPRGRARRRATTFGAIATMVLVLAACIPVFGDDTGGVRRYVMSRYSDASYLYDGDMADLTVLDVAPFTDGNVREFFWDTKHPYLADQQTCMNWETIAKSGSETTQPGLAMRIAPNGPDGKGLKAISINENIWSAAVWVIKVLLWESDGTDTRDGSDHSFVGAASFDASAIVGKMWMDNGVLHSTLIRAPWHICARTQGLQVTVKLWTGTNPEPAWDDPVHVFTSVLPEGWDYPGYSGGYLGHLAANQTATFSGFSTTPLCLVPDMTGTPYCQALLDAATSSTSAPPTTVTSTSAPPTTDAAPPATSIPPPPTTDGVTTTTLDVGPADSG